MNLTNLDKLAAILNKIDENKKLMLTTEQATSMLIEKLDKLLDEIKTTSNNNKPEQKAQGTHSKIKQT